MGVKTINLVAKATAALLCTIHICYILQLIFIIKIILYILQIDNTR